MYLIIANEVKQSLPTFRKAYDSPFIWHSGCFWQFASQFHRVLEKNNKILQGNKLKIHQINIAN